MSILDGKRAVLFDLGGTLIEFEEKQSWSQLELDGMKKCHAYLTQVGFDLPNADDFAAQFAQHHREIWKDIAQHRREVMYDRRLSGFLSRFAIDLGDHIERLVKEFYTVVSAQLAAIDGSIEALTAVAKKGLAIGLVSNSPFPAEWHRSEMKEFGLYDYFDYTVFSSEFGMRKPDPSIFRDCLDNLEVAPSEAIHVGDRPTEDIVGANCLGITTVLIRRNDRKLPSDIKPDYTIDNVAELIST
jgi:putative hydrolase of the HAD superfamily